MPRFLVDTNVLLAATFEELPSHEAARTLMERIFASDDPWCLSWVNVYEYLRVATHARVFARPLPFTDALRQVEEALGHPGLTVLTETQRHRTMLRRAVTDAGGARGNFVHDCHVAALMLEHDVRLVITEDRHFRRFTFIEAKTIEQALT